MKLRILFLLLLSASTCFGYDVVLKNGKILSGAVVKENQEMIILQDSEGIQLQLRQNQIDWDKTKERNKKAEPAATPIEEAKPVIEPQKAEVEKPQKVEVEKSKTKGRVYTKEDLEKMPELSIVGTKESAEEAARRNERHNEKMAQQAEDEAAWNDEALRIDDQIQQAKESYEYNKSFCDKVVPDYSDLRDGGYVIRTVEQYEEERRWACGVADDAARDLKKAEAEMEALQEDARKKGIPPGWVDPDRIRN